MHIEYNTARAAESRRQNILDAQKRRLYRRAHGMEDMTADEVSGVDVRGLVEWDDGLTNKERERGGVYSPGLLGREVVDMGGLKPGEENVTQVMERRRKEQAEMKVKREQERIAKMEEEERENIERLRRIGARGYRPGEEFGVPLAEGEQRRRKVWLGIWG